MQVEPEHYKHTYDSKRRFVSYWHQIKEIISLDPKNILEIGIGNGFVSRYLKQLGFTVTTVDFDARLKPDCVAKATALPFKDASFDVVASFEVLEHMPYEEALTSLREMQRISKRYVIVSTPDATRTYRIELQAPFLGNFKKLIHIPLLPREKSPVQQHHWEVGLKQYPLRRVADDFTSAGFIIEKTYQVFENHRHRFFILEKHSTNSKK